MRETNAITDDEYHAALAEPIIGKRFGARTQVEAPYVAEMVRAEMIRRFGASAYTTGLKVTTTIDSRLQLAANNAIRRTLVAYDERHGYRGPLARVDLSGVDVSIETLEAEEQLRDLFADYADLLGYETGLVLTVDDAGATVYFRGRGRQLIDLPAVEWAAPFVSDDEVGAKPTRVADVLAPGDIVRFRTAADGTLRLGQIPEVQGAFVSVDPQDGAVVALTGGFDFFLSNYNRAVQARRQPGSAFKPFVYSAALDNGFNAASIINDAPPDIGYDPVLERVWRPENFGGRVLRPGEAARRARGIDERGLGSSDATGRRRPDRRSRAPLRLRRRRRAPKSVIGARGGRRGADRSRERIRDFRERRISDREILRRAGGNRERRSALRGDCPRSSAGTRICARRRRHNSPTRWARRFRAAARSPRRRGRRVSRSPSS